MYAFLVSVSTHMIVLQVLWVLCKYMIRGGLAGLLLTSAGLELLRHAHKNALIGDDAQAADVRAHFALAFRRRRIQNCEQTGRVECEQKKKPYR